MGVTRARGRRRLAASPPVSGESFRGNRTPTQSTVLAVRNTVFRSANTVFQVAWTELRVPVAMTGIRGMVTLSPASGPAIPVTVIGVSGMVTVSPQ